MYVMIKANIGQFCGRLDLVIPIPTGLLALKLKCTPWVLFTTTRPHADRHRFTSARRLQPSRFTLALRNNQYERKPTGRFNQHFQLCSPKYRFTYKAPWECLPEFSRCIISISLSHHLVRMANTHKLYLTATGLEN